MSGKDQKALKHRKIAAIRRENVKRMGGARDVYTLGKRFDKGF